MTAGAAQGSQRSGGSEEGAGGKPLNKPSEGVMHSHEDRIARLGESRSGKGRRGPN